MYRFQCGHISVRSERVSPKGVNLAEDRPLCVVWHATEATSRFLREHNCEHATSIAIGESIAGHELSVGEDCILYRICGRPSGGSCIVGLRLTRSRLASRPIPVRGAKPDEPFGQMTPKPPSYPHFANASTIGRTGCDRLLGFTHQLVRFTLATRSTLLSRLIFHSPAWMGRSNGAAPHAGIAGPSPWSYSR